jgi:hypothetical protein
MKPCTEKAESLATSCRFSHQLRGHQAERMLGVPLLCKSACFFVFLNLVLFGGGVFIFI